MSAAPPSQRPALYSVAELARSATYAAATYGTDAVAAADGERCGPA